MSGHRLCRDGGQWFLRGRHTHETGDLCILRGTIRRSGWCLRGGGIDRRCPRNDVGHRRSSNSSVCKAFSFLPACLLTLERFKPLTNQFSLHFCFLWLRRRWLGLDRHNWGGWWRLRLRLRSLTSSWRRSRGRFSIRERSLILFVLRGLQPRQICRPICGGWGLRDGHWFSNGLNRRFGDSRAEWRSLCRSGASADRLVLLASLHLQCQMMWMLTHCQSLPTLSATMRHRLRLSPHPKLYRRCLHRKLGPVHRMLTLRQNYSPQGVSRSRAM